MFRCPLAPHPRYLAQALERAVLLARIRDYEHIIDLDTIDRSEEMMAWSLLHPDDDLKAKAEAWRSRLQEFQTQLWNDHDSQLPSKLYHYSGLDSICKILRSQEIWASDVLAMKETTDGRYWLKIFRRALCRNRNSVPDYVRGWFNPTGRFGLNEHWGMYVSCFSETETLDNQWKRYANEGSGCAIEVSFDALSTSPDAGKKYAWMKMLYDPGVQNDFANRTVKHAIWLAHERGVTSAEDEFRYWQQYASFTFLHCGLRFKRRKYWPEREWRVFVIKTDSDAVRNRPGVDGSRISYVGVPMRPDIVTALVRGPACTKGNTELLSLLGETGYTGASVK
jgi:hypothetical protein